MRTAYAVALLFLAMVLAYAFGAINAGAVGYRAVDPVASDFLRAAFPPGPGASFLLVLLAIAAAAGAAMLFRRGGSEQLLDLLGTGKAAQVQSMVVSRHGGEASAHEVLLATLAVVAGACCVMTMWGVAERWNAETIGLLGVITAFQVVCALVMLVLVIVRGPRSIPMFAPSAVAVLAEVGIVVAVGIFGSA